MISRFQLIAHDYAAAHAANTSNPTFAACTISGDSCPALQFAGNARGKVVATDIKSRDYSAVLLTGGSKPKFDRCNIVANNGHAVFTSNRACGTFETCTLKATETTSTLLNEDESFSKFLGNRVWVRRGALIEVTGFARGRFERNRLEPDPEHKVEEEARKLIKKPLFGRLPQLPPIPKPIQVSAQHRARFAGNRLPDGSEAMPVVMPTTEARH